MLTPAARQAWMSISVFSTGTASSVMVCQTKTGGVLASMCFSMENLSSKA